MCFEISSVVGIICWCLFNYFEINGVGKTYLVFSYLMKVLSLRFGNNRMASSIIGV